MKMKEERERERDVEIVKKHNTNNVGLLLMRTCVRYCNTSYVRVLLFSREDYK